jgi:hypothetical protein
MCVRFAWDVLGCRHAIGPPIPIQMSTDDQINPISIEETFSGLRAGKGGYPEQEVDTRSRPARLEAGSVENDFVLEFGDRDGPAGLLMNVLTEGLGTLGFPVHDEDSSRVILQRAEPTE